MGIPSGYGVLEAHRRQQVQVLVEERGETAAASALSLKPETLVRALAERPVRLGTLALIDRGLEALGPAHIGGIVATVLESLVERAVAAGQNPAEIAAAGGPVAAAVERVLARRAADGR